MYALARQIGSLTRAFEQFALAILHATLPAELLRLVPIANARTGEGRALSVRTLGRWHSMIKGIAETEMDARLAALCLALVSLAAAWGAVRS